MVDFFFHHLTGSLPLSPCAIGDMGEEAFFFPQNCFLMCNANGWTAVLPTQYQDGRTGDSDFKS